MEPAKPKARPKQPAAAPVRASHATLLSTQSASQPTCETNSEVSVAACGRGACVPPRTARM
eukprot:113711-Prymnesium_polylepis.2